MEIILEIRPGEGGADARDLAQIHTRIYLKYAASCGLRTAAVDQPG